MGDDTIFLVAGARPNFMKIAPLVWELKRRHQSNYRVVHTGQHYDYEMSRVFFDDLGLAPPDFYLNVGSGTHAFQTAGVMRALEEICIREAPGLVVVVGDVNSTLAGALVGAKLGIPVAHVEAGLRSFDRSMPEEINRVVTDHLADLLFVTEASGARNLRDEGIPEDRVHFVGNTMIDTLVRILPTVEAHAAPEADYALATIHRPSNVDDRDDLARIVEILAAVSGLLPVLFFAHPRTARRITDYGMDKRFRRLDAPTKDLEKTVCLLQPVGYSEFLSYQAHAKVVLTDSGGIQEETTYLGVPCVTLRDNTERPVTEEIGTNIVTGRDINKIMKAVREVVEGSFKKGRIPDLWDGKAAGRIVDVICGRLDRNA